MDNLIEEEMGDQGEIEEDEGEQDDEVEQDRDESATLQSQSLTPDNAVLGSHGSIQGQI